MGFTVVLLSLSFWNPSSVVLPHGKRASLHGSGPPVLFSSGLFGLMPRRLYTKLFQELSQNVTLAVIEDASATSATDVSGLAYSLGVDGVGLLAHSAIDVNVLQSPHVRAAVLCDPVVLPRWGSAFGASPPEPELAGDVLILKAPTRTRNRPSHPTSPLTFPSLGRALSPGWDTRTSWTTRADLGPKSPG